MSHQTFASLLSGERIAATRRAGLWSDRTIIDLFEVALARDPERLAFVSHNSQTGRSTRTTYRELADHAAAVASLLRTFGVAHGQVVSVQLPSCWQFVAILLACARIGCPINPILPAARRRDVTLMCGHCDSRVLFHPKAFRGTEYGPLIDGFRGELPRELRPVEIDLSLDTLGLAVAGAGAAPRDEGAPMTADDVAEIIFTSGTTGDPKGVMHSWNTLLAAVDSFIDRAKPTHDDIILMASPLAHQTGFLWGALLPIALGSTAVLLDAWSPAVALKLIAAERATFSVSAPTFLSDLLDHTAGQKLALRTFVLAGAPVPEVLVRRAASEQGITIASAWGMTEVGLCTMTADDDGIDDICSSSGRPMAGAEVRVLDADGSVAPAGVEGRLVARGAFNFVGYLRRPDLYATDAEGWFDTGDLAIKSQRGYVRITGRTKDLIIRGGENIPVADIENILYKHPGIQDVAIVGMPDDRLGERACAFVTVRSAESIDLTDLTTFLASEGVTRSYFPERMVVVDELPRTPSGKIQKFVLRQWASSAIAAEPTGRYRRQ